MKGIKVLLLVLTVSFISFSGEKEYSKRLNRIDIDDSSIDPVTLSVEVPESTVDFSFGLNESKNMGKIMLIYDRESRSDLLYTYPWKYEVLLVDNSTSETYSLEVSWNETDGIYSDYELIGLGSSLPSQPALTNSLSLELVSSTASYNAGTGWVTVTNSNLDPHIPADIHLELSIKTERYYELDPTIKSPLRVEETNQTLDAKWHFIEGAEEYDLEWVYVDKLTVLGTEVEGELGATINPETIFDRKEGTMVRLKDTKYSIDNVFSEGYVFFRVRTVGRYIGGEVNGDYSYIKTGDWNYYNSNSVTEGSNLLAYRTITANSNEFEPNKTWSYSVGFAENGKFSSGVSYYDGSLRSRQSTAYNSTDNVTLKSESKYDYEGRPIISLSPAPVLGRDLSYEAGFNTVNGLPLDKSDYDTTTSAVLDNTSGISQYYSSANPFEQENGGAIPDVQGYAYGQIKYKQDGSGRIEKSGGVGKEFNINGYDDPNNPGNNISRATEYYYGTPTYSELKRLFGSNVSDNNNYYKKTMIKDPNGQYSASYSDGSGKTIATTLLGLPPENLKPLDGGIEEITTPLNTGNTLTNNGYTLESNFQFLNSVEDNPVTFEYDFTGIIFQYTDLGTTPKCLDCQYTLDIIIEAPDGTETIVHEDVSHTTFDGLCDTDPNDPDYNTYITNFPISGTAIINFSMTFSQIGEYKIVKRLTVNTTAMLEDFTDGYANSSVFNNILTDYSNNVDLSGCYTDCDSYCEYISMYNYEQEHGVGTWANVAQASKDLLIATCLEEACDQDEVFNGDPSELDEYGNPETSLFQMQCNGYYTQMQDQIMGGVEFNDDDFWIRLQSGVDDGTYLFNTSYTDGVADGTDVSNVTTEMRDLGSDGILDEWIPQMVLNHREYCHYEMCESLVPSNQFDMNLNEYLDGNPVNGSWNLAYLEHMWGQGVGVSPDPFLIAEDSDGNVYNDVVATNLFTRLQNFTDPCDGTTGLNIYEFINALSTCSLATNGVTGTSPPNYNGEEKFNLFKGLYAHTKQQVIDEYKADQSCDYFTDDHEIFMSASDLNSDSPGGTDMDEFVADNVDFFTPDVTAVCDASVNSWMNDVDQSCMTHLEATTSITDPSIFMDQELENLFFDYCQTHTSTANPSGLFFNSDPTTNMDLEYNAIIGPVGLLTTECPLYQPNFIVTQPSTVAIPGGMQSVQCIQEAVDELNAFYLSSITTFLSNNPPVTNVHHVVLDPIVNAGIYDCGLGPVTKQWHWYQDNTGIIQEEDIDLKKCNLFRVLDNGQVVDFSTISLIENLDLAANGELTADVTINGIVVNCKLDYSSIINGVQPCYNLVQEDFIIMTEIPGEITYNFPDWEADCITQILEEANQNAIDNYNAQVGAGQGDFLTDSPECLENINERFTMKYKLYEYNYTLFYYDQSGSLVQTIPPAGVVPVASTAFDAVTGLLPNNVEPAHDEEQFTIYTYKGGQMSESQTPDGGVVKYYYDDLFRPRFTQNEEQANFLSGGYDRFSYIKYDDLGRSVESGEAFETNSNFLVNTVAEKNNQDYPSSTNRYDYTKTYYEEIPTNMESSVFTNGQQNLRNNVAAVEHYSAQYHFETAPNNTFVNTEVTTVMLYSYNSQGNVVEYAQRNSKLADLGMEDVLFKYEYDLISGTIQEVIYQEDKLEEWRHKYHYDAANRLVRSFTSDDGIEWDMDAKYFYYLHGSLARVERGEDNVQGTDYAYNPQGWFKGANSTYLDPSKDIGEDGHTTGLDKFNAKDAFGFSLGYYDGDYISNSGTNYFANTDYLTTQNGTYGNLYNGNVSNMVTAMKDVDENIMATTGNIYTYDLLQRIKSMDVYQVSATTANYNDYLTNGFASTNSVDNGAYATSYVFDKNGNLQNLTRNDQFAVQMDNLSYEYNDQTGNVNQLNHVLESATGTVIMSDIKTGQTTDNYVYDNIGQLTYDAQEQLAYEWTHDGKVKRVNKLVPNGDDVSFVYDASGNRIMKIEGNFLAGDEIEEIITYYIYDISGNLMSTYKKEISFQSNNMILVDLKLEEQVIYGAKRLGVKKVNKSLTSTRYMLDINGVYSQYSITDNRDNYDHTERLVGHKYYEMSNHLNNVLEVITDRKIPDADGLAYEADIISTSDYYPYGMLMPGRHSSTNLYRYGFNGMEKDDEVSGEGNSYTTEFRAYDPRIARWKSTDPVTHAQFSPYSAFDNNPIYYADPSGADSQDWWENDKGDIIWHDATGNVGDKSSLQGVDGEWTNLGRTINIETTSDIRSPYDIPIPGGEGTKLTTSYSITGHYNNDGSFATFTSDFQRTTGKTFDKFEGAETADGKTNSQTPIYKIPYPTNNTGSYTGGFSQHTQVTWWEGIGLKEVTGGHIVDVNQVVTINLIKSNEVNGMYTLSLDLNHGTFPSVWMEVSNGVTSQPVYRYQQCSFTMTHCNKVSLGYLTAWYDGSASDAYDLFLSRNKRMSKYYNKNWINFNGYNAGTFKFTPPKF